MSCSEEAERAKSEELDLVEELNKNKRYLEILESWKKGQ